MKRLSTLVVGMMLGVVLLTVVNWNGERQRQERAAVTAKCTAINGTHFRHWCCTGSGTNIRCSEAD